MTARGRAAFVGASARVAAFTVLAAGFAWTAPARAQYDSAVQELASHFGRVDFVMNGASMTDATGLRNGVNCLLASNSVTIKSESLPTRPFVVAAYLLWGGSLIGNDRDFNSGPDIFTSTGRADVPADLPQVVADARAAMDTSVNLLLPGDTDPRAVQADSDGRFISVYYKTFGPEQGNIAFFLARADISALLIGRDRAQLAGTYTVSGLTADVCNGLEAHCTSPIDICSNTGTVHTNGTASFALVLVLRDPALPLRRVTLFNGMQGLNNSATAVHLGEGINVSDPPRGTLVYYVMEGDDGISDSQSDVEHGQLHEYVAVDGGSQVLYLHDANNPLGNPFNGTITTVHNSPPLASCLALGLGDGVCGVAGVDIDLYDITSSLRPHARAIDVTFSTGVDRVFIASLVAGVDVFSPVLSEDSRLVVIDADTDNVPALAPLTYLLAVSRLPVFETARR
jgi:hypothetical protein